VVTLAVGRTFFHLATWAALAAGYDWSGQLARRLPVLAIALTIVFLVVFFLVFPNGLIALLISIFPVLWVASVLGDYRSTWDEKRPKLIGTSLLCAVVIATVLYLAARS
jgi:hypothetical protein